MTTADDLGISRRRKKGGYKRGRYAVRSAVDGHPPNPADRAVLLATFTGFPDPVTGDEREWWQLWLRPLHSTMGDWWSLKLCATAGPGKLVGVVSAKANYWIGWHPVRECFNVVSDVARLEKGRPELAEAVRNVLKGLYLGDFEFELRIAPKGSLPREYPLTIPRDRGRRGGETEATGEIENDEDLL